jgi:hypothetical protein
VTTANIGNLERLPDLAAMPQQVIGEHAGHHRLTHRHGADADAGVVAALGEALRDSAWGQRDARGVAAILAICEKGRSAPRSILTR